MNPGPELDKWLSDRLFPGQPIGEYSTDTAAALNTLVPAMEARGFVCWDVGSLGFGLEGRLAMFWDPDDSERRHGSADHSTIAGAVALAAKAAMEQEGKSDG